jgi:hypothetical protein
MAQYMEGIFVRHGRWTAQRALAELPDVAESVIEVVDGSLVLSPLTDSRYQDVVTRLWHVLDKAARAVGLEAVPEADVVLGEDLACPHVCVLNRLDRDRGWIDSAEAVLVAEVLPSRADRQCRFVRPEKYAMAGIGHYMRVEFRGWTPVVFLRELAGRDYRLVGAAAAGTTFSMREPFPLEFDPAELVEA